MLGSRLWASIAHAVSPRRCEAVQVIMADAAVVDANALSAAVPKRSYLHRICAVAGQPWWCMTPQIRRVA